MSPTDEMSGDEAILHERDDAGHSKIPLSSSQCRFSRHDGDSRRMSICFVSYDVQGHSASLRAKNNERDSREF